MQFKLRLDGFQPESRLHVHAGDWPQFVRTDLVLTGTLSVSVCPLRAVAEVQFFKCNRENSSDSWTESTVILTPYEMRALAHALKAGAELLEGRNHVA